MSISWPGRSIVARRRRDAPLRVAFFGEFGCGNLGNEASLTTGISWVRAALPVAELMCFCRDPDYVRRVHGIPAFLMYGPRPDVPWLRRLPHGLTHAIYKVNDQVRITWMVGRADVLIVPGMGVFESALAGPPWGLPFAMAGLSVATRMRRRTLALIGVGVSNEPNRITRLLNKITVTGSSFLSFRDEYSRKSMAGQGISRPTGEVFPDIAFALGTARRRDGGKQSLDVGLGMLAYYDQYDPAAGDRVAERFESAMIEFGGWLMAQGHRVQLLIGDGSDDAVAQRVLSGLTELDPGCVQEGRAGYRRVTDHGSLSDTVDQLDAVVGSRYHNLVFALKSGAPALSVGYAPKCTELLDDAGLAGFSQMITEVSAAELKDQFGRLTAEYDRYAGLAYDYAVQARQSTQIHRELFTRAVFGAAASAGATAADTAADREVLR